MLAAPARSFLPPLRGVAATMRRAPSAVPRNAVARIQELHADGSPRAAFYQVGGKVVAYRQWRETGEIELEYALRDGVKHGKEYHFHANGRPLTEETFRRGKRHGVGRQWSERGELLIQWRMTHGVGRTFWCDPETGILLEEHARPPKKAVGYQRQWNADARTVWQEYYFLLGKGYHGIWREWDKLGRLRRGFPRYYVRGRRVSKSQYLAASLTRRALPPYRREDDAPQRDPPREYKKPSPPRQQA